MQTILIILVVVMILLQVVAMYKVAKMMQSQNAVNSARYAALTQSLITLRTQSDKTYELIVNRFKLIMDNDVRTNLIIKQNANSANHMLESMNCVLNNTDTLKTHSINANIELDFVRANMTRRKKVIVNPNEIQDFIDAK